MCLRRGLAVVLIMFVVVIVFITGTVGTLLANGYVKAPTDSSVFLCEKWLLYGCNEPQSRPPIALCIAIH